MANVATSDAEVSPKIDVPAWEDLAKKLGLDSVESDADRYALFKALPFAQKLEALTSLLGSSDHAMQTPLVVAILSDLAEEQLNLRQVPPQPGVTSDVMGEQLLPRLTQLVAAAPQLKSQSGALPMLTKMVAQLQAGLATAHHDRDPGSARRRDGDAEIATATLLHRLRVGLFDRSRTDTGRAGRRDVSDSMHLLVAQGLTLNQLRYPHGTPAIETRERARGPSAQPVPDVVETPWYRPAVNGPPNVNRDKNAAVVRGGFGSRFLSLFQRRRYDDNGNYVNAVNAGGYGGYYPVYPAYGGLGTSGRGWGGWGGWGGWWGGHHGHGAHGGHGGHGGFGGHGGHGGFGGGHGGFGGGGHGG